MWGSGVLVGLVEFFYILAIYLELVVHLEVDRNGILLGLLDYYLIRLMLLLIPCLVINHLYSFPFDHFPLQLYLVPQPVNFRLIPLIFKLILLPLDYLKMYWQNILLILLKFQHPGRHQHLMYHLLKLRIIYQSLILLSHWRAIFRPQLFQLICIISSVSTIGLILHQIQLFSCVEDAILLGVGEHYGLDETRTDAVDEVMDLLVIGVETIGKALS